VELPGERGYFKHPAVVEQEQAMARAAAARAAQDREYALLSGLSHVPPESAAAMAYGDVPGSVAMPPREPAPTGDRTLTRYRRLAQKQRWLKERL